MKEPLQRRSLTAAFSAPEPIPQEAIAAVAAQNGFLPAAPISSPPAAVTDISARRRHRQPTGRDHQFNVRLRKDTLDFIYAEANERNIPIAQVIEEGMEALKRQQISR